MNKYFWTISDLAAHLQVARSWIYHRTRKCSSDAIPHIRLGKYVRFDPESESFRQWLENHKVGSPTQHDSQTAENAPKKDAREQFVSNTKR
ncbi:MAG TPA: helix-turn-helix domain-containing protein [Acidobacteriota bacterium]|jgi:predicted DNA-binding transcriptional regulator AlpA